MAGYIFLTILVATFALGFKGDRKDEELW